MDWNTNYYQLQFQSVDEIHENDYQPSQQDIIDYAKSLGIDPSSDN